MKIALLSPIARQTPPRNYGPWEQVVANIAEGLVRREYDVTVFATADSCPCGNLESIVSVPYEDDKTQDPKVVESLHIANFFERAAGFDIIHNIYDFLPLTYSGLIDTPVVTTIHGFSSCQAIDVYKKYSTLPVNSYVSVSNSARDPKLDYIATVYNGIKMEDFDLSEDVGDCLLCFGSIYPEKGTVDAVRIAKSFGMKLIIAGIVRDKQYFEEEVKPLIDNKTVSFIGESDLSIRNRLLGKAYALLHPICFDEPFGMSVVESMACGTPVIAYNRGAVGELVVNGQNGFLVDTVEEAVEALKSIETIDRAGCRRWVEKRFSSEKMVDDYISVYKQVLGASPSHAFPPWGHWEVLVQDERYKVKRITVKAGKRLSYHKHFKHDETWTIVSGQGRIILDGTYRKVVEGDVIHIPREVSHRIANDSAQPFVFIEVQHGRYLGEEDIVRLEDDYGRS